MRQQSTTIANAHAAERIQNGAAAFSLSERFSNTKSKRGPLLAFCDRFANAPDSRMTLSLIPARNRLLLPYRFQLLALRCEFLDVESSMMRGAECYAF
jgi:hypothetical protein